MNGYGSYGSGRRKISKRLFGDNNKNVPKLQIQATAGKMIFFYRKI